MAGPAASRAVVDEWRSVRARRRREAAVAALEPPDQAVPSGQDEKWTPTRVRYRLAGGLTRAN